MQQYLVNLIKFNNLIAFFKEIKQFIRINHKQSLIYNLSKLRFFFLTQKYYKVKFIN